MFLVLLNEIKHFVSSLEVINLDEAKLHSSMKAKISKDFLKAYLLLYILTIQFLFSLSFSFVKLVLRIIT